MLAMSAATFGLAHAAPFYTTPWETGYVWQTAN
jgi:hypothetical protein